MYTELGFRIYLALITGISSFLPTNAGDFILKEDTNDAFLFSFQLKMFIVMEYAGNKEKLTTAVVLY